MWRRTQGVEYNSIVEVSGGHSMSYCSEPRAAEASCCAAGHSRLVTRLRCTHSSLIVAAGMHPCATGSCRLGPVSVHCAVHVSHSIATTQRPPDRTLATWRGLLSKLHLSSSRLVRPAGSSASCCSTAAGTATPMRLSWRSGRSCQAADSAARLGGGDADLHW